MLRGPLSTSYLNGTCPLAAALVPHGLNHVHQFAWPAALKEWKLVYILCTCPARASCNQINILYSVMKPLSSRVHHEIMVKPEILGWTLLGAPKCSNMKAKSLCQFFVAFECDLDVPPNAWRLSLCCDGVSSDKGHHWPNRPCCHRRRIKTIITSSHDHEEYAAFYFEALSQLHYMGKMMILTGSQ